MSDNVNTDPSSIEEGSPELNIGLEVEKIRQALPDAILEVTQRPERGMFWIDIRMDTVVPVGTLLRDDPQLAYNMLADVHGADYPQRGAKRFDVVYNLYSIPRNRRLFLRLMAGENDLVPTLSGVYPNADWAEREITDLFGLNFKDHPDPRRIMMPDDWEGHPLRKDYPLIGRRPVMLFNDVKDVM